MQQKAETSSSVASKAKDQLKYNQKIQLKAEVAKGSLKVATKSRIAIQKIKYRKAGFKENDVCDGIKELNK